MMDVDGWLPARSDRGRTRGFACAKRRSTPQAPQAQPAHHAAPAARGEEETKGRRFRRICPPGAAALRFGTTGRAG